jgi:hypothetical protein
MMRVRVLLFGFVVLIFCGISLTVADEAEDMCIPMGTIELAPPETVEAKRSAVAFHHPTHFDFACMECHHTWDKVSAIQGCMTSGCHDLDKLEKKDAANKTEAMRYYKNAYHKMCITCHKEIKAQNAKIEKSQVAIEGKLMAAGPTSCLGCHPKDE